MLFRSQESMPANPFAALADEEDEVLDQGTVAAEPKVSKPAEGKAPAKAAAKPKEAKPASKDAAPKSDAPRQSRPKSDRPPRAEKSAAGEESTVTVPEGKFGKEPRGRGGADRGGRQGAAFKNEHHSHMKTSKPHSRENGKFNWGNETDTIAEGQSAFESGEAHAPAAPTEAVTVAAVVETEAPKEDEPVQFTLEEFLRQKEAKKTAALPKQRKAGEGEDAKWPEGQTLVKDDEDKADSKEETAERKSQRSLKKQTVPIDVKFVSAESAAAPRDSFRGRGRGRGGFRGGPRGGPRGGHSAPRRTEQQSSSAPYKVSDSDFPSL